MNKTFASGSRLTVILLNALVFPGLGHIMAKKKITGVLIASCFMVVSVVLTVKFFYGFFVFYTGQTESYGFFEFLSSLWEDAVFRYFLAADLMIWMAALLDSFRITGKN